jgi:hypothetical protein
MDTASLLDPLNYSANKGYGHPERINAVAPWNQTAMLHFDKMFKTGKEYVLEISQNITDCEGLPLLSGPAQRFAIPLPPAVDEVFISEILFDPKPYCPRFIELHNPGPGTLDLADIRIGRRRLENGQLESVAPVVDGHYLFFPGDYLALTSDPDGLRSCYYVPDPEMLVLCKDLPVMDEREGSAVIVDKYLQVLDECPYNRSMHYPLLTSVEGVSLERISFDVASYHAWNWHSAAASGGYATPGRENSQQHDLKGMRGIAIEPVVFTPDGDGKQDLVMIMLDSHQPGDMVTVRIMDPRGRTIKRIAENHLL